MTEDTFDWGEMSKARPLNAASPVTPAVPLETRIAHAVELISHSKYLVAFTGAGISTESGLPDFRGPNGLWTRWEKGLPMHDEDEADQDWEDATPNPGHYALVQLQNWGLLKYLISQNIDNLHLKSGIRKDLLAELHGNMTLFRCEKCHQYFPKDDVWDEDKWGVGYRSLPPMRRQPKCPVCKGRIYNSIVNFGEPLPEEELVLSNYHVMEADVVLAIGSSLVVTPAAELPEVAVTQNHA